MKATISESAVGGMDLVWGLRESSARQNEATAKLLEVLAEADRRGLADEEGCPSLFAYCTDRLGFSEGTAFRSIRAARAAARFPEILELIRRGALPTASAAVLAPYLTPANSADFLRRARGMGTWELRFMLASLGPEAFDPEIDRGLPACPDEDPGDEDPDAAFDNMGLFA